MALALGLREVPVYDLSLGAGEVQRSMMAHATDGARDGHALLPVRTLLVGMPRTVLDVLVTTWSCVDLASSETLRGATAARSGRLFRKVWPDVMTGDWCMTGGLW